VTPRFGRSRRPIGRRCSEETADRHCRQNDARLPGDRRTLGRPGPRARLLGQGTRTGCGRGRGVAVRVCALPPRRRRPLSLGWRAVRSISLFSGAGGLDLGCEAAGFVTSIAVENNPVAGRTLLANRKYFPLLEADSIVDEIVETPPEEIVERSGVARGELDLVHGGPPCTPFSKSGYWLAYKRAGEDPKASLLDNYAEVVRVAQPKAFIMENVFALGYRNQNRPVFERFIRAINAAGYSFDFKVLVAADYGVPQNRQRLICVGIRNDLLDVPSAFWRFTWPEPTHSGPHETRTGWDPSLPGHRTTAQAFEGLDATNNPPETEEVVRGTYAEELFAVPPGDNYLWWTAHRGHAEPRFKWRSRYWTFLLKLHPERPSPTIQGQPGPWVGPFHWENRRLRVGELKRLMEFPDDFVVTGSRRDQQLQLGNAVPPRLGHVVAHHVALELERLGAVDRELLAA
jgi:DNA (cytosine-5)-methyltransferase 1